MSRRDAGAGMLATLSLVLALGLGGCDDEPAGETVITFPGSALGAESRLLETQLQRFMEANPDIRVVQRRTPDAADQRHQLYVQWLNARAGDPDILQLDVIWTPEFAAAGWILPLDRFGPDEDAFFPATVRANTWDGRLFALPWWIDLGMLYWRTDLMDAPPATFRELASVAARSQAGRQGGSPAREGSGQGGRPEGGGSAGAGRGGPEGGVRFGFVWQGARYEGLVTVFLEHLGGFGGRIMTDGGRVLVDSDAAVRALTFLRDAVHESGISPRSVLTWREEQTRFAFQNGQAAFMRNWPYAYPLLQDSAESRVAGRFDIAPMPAAPSGRPTAVLGGSQLAINAHTEHPEAAYRLVEFLTRPKQMIERARVSGQYPTRSALYRGDTLADALPIPPEKAEAIARRAVPRPVTPVYSQMSSLLQVQLHRALTRQKGPRDALEDAARDIRRLLSTTGIRKMMRESRAAGAAGDAEASGSRGTP